MKSEQWIGHRTGKLSIVAFEGIKVFGKGRSAYFRFQCDCGREFVAQKSNVLGRRIDCGCSRRSIGTAPANATRHPLYKTWWAMIDRCENQKNTSFKNYGARGIKVSHRWKFGADGLTGFECFLADMGERAVGMTIERVQRNGNYEPGNCMWLPKGDQSKNRRGVRMVRIGDQVRTIPEWCAATGVGYWTAIRRISRGWPPDRAVTTQSAKRVA